MVSSAGAAGRKLILTGSSMRSSDSMPRAVYGYCTVYRYVSRMSGEPQMFWVATGCEGACLLDDVAGLLLASEDGDPLGLWGTEQGMAGELNCLTVQGEQVDGAQVDLVVCSLFSCRCCCELFQRFFRANRPEALEEKK